MKALIVRMSSIGDVVHALPALAALRHQGWEAGWLVESPAAPLLERNTALMRVHRLPRAQALTLGAARRVAAEVRLEQYDVALDFQGLWKSALWARFAGAPRVVGFASGWRREPLSALLIREGASPTSEAVHVIDKNLALLRALGIDEVGLREFPLPPSEAEAVTVRQGLKSLGLGGFVILNPGGGWASKLWPPESYGTVARALRERGLEALVTWGPGEQALADRVVRASEGAAVRCFPTTLLEYMELCRETRLVIAADTGPLHVASAVGAPVLGLYGPTDPERNGPFSPDDRVVRRVPLCSPCHRRRCRVHDGVMRAITPTEVVRAIDARLGISFPESRAV
ncbi:MAG TPA: glycosyltransferase family 9 protein [Vicinamibacteria bacterium]|nr:glycosyltransferase family 9 protein [Vicinamibacteria bacterium]